MVEERAKDCEMADHISRRELDRATLARQRLREHTDGDEVSLHGATRGVRPSGAATARLSRRERDLVAAEGAELAAFVHAPVDHVRVVEGP